MSDEFTVGGLRDAASVVLADVDLSQVYMVHCDIHVRPEMTGRRLRSAFNVQTRASRSEASVQAWAKYAVIALTDDDGSLPDNANELTEDLIEQTYAWRIETEWVADFGGDSAQVAAYSDADLAAFALIMAPPTLHPHVRELVQSLTSRSPFPAYTMGLLTPISAMGDDEIVELYAEEGNDLGEHE